VTDERTRTINRIQKVLEGANIKLASVATDITGKSGRAILEALSQGQTDAARLADLAVGKLIKKRSSLEEALVGTMDDHQRFMLKVLLKTLSEQDQTIEELDSEVEGRMRPFEDMIEQLDPVPGIARRGAEDLLAVIGTDMNRYPSADHLASWLRLCPGNCKSANKRLSGRTAKGSPYGKTLMVQLAWGAARTNGSYLQALFKRLSGRRGAKRAIVAVAHSMVVSIYHMLSKNIPYKDLGPNWYDQVNKEKVVKRSVKRLEKLGYVVQLEPIAA
jgi:transposase